MIHWIPVCITVLIAVPCFSVNSLPRCVPGTSKSTSPQRETGGFIQHPRRPDHRHKRPMVDRNPSPCHRFGMFLPTCTFLQHIHNNENNNTNFIHVPFFNKSLRWIIWIKNVVIWITGCSEFCGPDSLRHWSSTRYVLFPFICVG